MAQVINTRGGKFEVWDCGQFIDQFANPRQAEELAAVLELCDSVEVEVPTDREVYNVRPQRYL